MPALRTLTARRTAVALAVLALAACGQSTRGAADAVPTGATSTPATSSATPAATTTAPQTSAPKTTAPPARAATPRPTQPRGTASGAATSTHHAGPVTRLSAVPRAGAEPRVRFPKNQPAVGGGANARVQAVPDAVWDRMVGYSWTSGCPVGRSSLRYVTVNFWGFDGKRSRGALVVHSSIARATERAFTRLYDLRFRIRQMRVMDSAWGHNPKGPGADDYAAMEADNTSAFNCRYVGGQESRKVYSNHAYGRAVDVNDFENPYVDDDGKVYPDSYFVHHRSTAPGVFAGSGSSAVHAFTDRGFGWGGRWSHPDFQHFEVPR